MYTQCTVCMSVVCIHRWIHHQNVILTAQIHWQMLKFWRPSFILSTLLGLSDWSGRVQLADVPRKASQLTVVLWVAAHSLIWVECRVEWRLLSLTTVYVVRWKHIYLLWLFLLVVENTLVYLFFVHETFLSFCTTSWQIYVKWWWWWWQTVVFISVSWSFIVFCCNFYSTVPVFIISMYLCVCVILFDESISDYCWRDLNRSVWYWCSAKRVSVSWLMIHKALVLLCLHVACCYITLWCIVCVCLSWLFMYTDVVSWHLAM